jgi:hypothetical protein|tara:strand:+ start:49 stop:231 length:183 start_codon:yes stop_codon:yes gene_type:complete
MEKKTPCGSPMQMVLRNGPKKKKKANSCWKGYVAKGKKKSPSGKKTKGGKTKMVNNCVKK